MEALAAQALDLAARHILMLGLGSNGRTRLARFSRLCIRSAQLRRKHCHASIGAGQPVSSGAAGCICGQHAIGQPGDVGCDGTAAGCQPGLLILSGGAAAPQFFALPGASGQPALPFALLIGQCLAARRGSRCIAGVAVQRG